MNIEEIIRNYLKSSDAKTPQLSALTYQLLEFWATTKDFEIDNKLLQELVFKYAAAEKNLKQLNTELTWRQDRIEEDLAAAAEIQKSLLPQKIDTIQHLAVAWKFKPCEKIGGDIFNMAQLDDNHWAIYMLDVSGHGVPAAMVAVSVFQNLHPLAGNILLKAGESRQTRNIRNPAKVLEKLDQEYTFDRFNNFFTINYVILNAATGSFTCSSAGHPPPIIIRQNGTLDILATGSPPIGTRDLRLADAPVGFPEEQKQLEAGEKLLFYTDGVFEYKNPKGEFYGYEQLHKKLVTLKDKPVSDLIDMVFESLMEFGQGKEPKDDISLLGIEFKRN
ncbi:Serine phosphatase RsbU, regulator of sigma subunit [Olavius sp. associated proteobacterium Delta 1]|nr:Serine phosphatase RsbU, regulator of sigma subunit [Olavius sp. associated proteobacterium Delta 1]